MASMTVQQPPDIRPSMVTPVPQEWAAIPLGTVHGGVWPNDYTEPPTWGATCPACDWWQTHYASPEAGYAALRVHERHNCPARADGRDR